MQKDANAVAEGLSVPKVFDRFVKDHALKILFDYSDSTKRKWPTITDEIVQFAVNIKFGQIPRLDRSSLEYWSKGGDIGDDKFRLIYHFLTHPNTISRPEFAHASVLKEPLHSLLRIGRTFCDFHNSNVDQVEDFFQQLFDKPIGEPAEGPILAVYYGQFQHINVYIWFERLKMNVFALFILFIRKFHLMLIQLSVGLHALVAILLSALELNGVIKLHFI